MGRLKIPKFGKIIISHNAQETIYSRKRAEEFLEFIPMLQLIYGLFRCPFRTVPSVELRGFCLTAKKSPCWAHL